MKPKHTPSTSNNPLKPHTYDAQTRRNIIAFFEVKSSIQKLIDNNALTYQTIANALAKTYPTEPKIQQDLLNQLTFNHKN